MKEKLEQIKEFVGKLSSKTKKLIIAGAALLLIAAVAVAFILNNHSRSLDSCRKAALILNIRENLRS